MKKIAVLSSTDYNSYPVGGMMSFIKDAAPEMARRFKVDFWGVDAGAGYNSFTSGGQTFPIHFFGSAKTGRKIIPNMIRVTWHLWRNRKALLEAGYDGIYIHGIPLNLAFPARIKPQRINHVHGLNNPFKSLENPGSTHSILFTIYEWIRRKALCESDLVLLAADDQGLEPFRKKYGSSGKIVKLANFCDVSTFKMSVQPANKGDAGMNDTDRVLLYVGRLSKEKDPMLAIKVLARVRSALKETENVRLVMIGDGYQRAETEDLARSLSVHHHVSFLGMQPRQIIAQWMRAADVFLLTSHFEGFPIVLAEAAQCGLPMVCTDITGVHDLVVPGVNGSLVSTRNPNDFTAPIADALANSATYGAQSRKVAAQYTPEIILDRLCREIADVL